MYFQISSLSRRKSSSILSRQTCDGLSTVCRLTVSVPSMPVKPDKTSTTKCLLNSGKGQHGRLVRAVYGNVGRQKVFPSPGQTDADRRRVRRRMEDGRFACRHDWRWPWTLDSAIIHQLDYSQRARLVYERRSTELRTVAPQEGKHRHYHSPKTDTRVV